MPVIKNQHYEKNFALFDKTGLDFDNRLSWAAKGILSYVLAKPGGWEVHVEDLVKRSVDGKTVVYSALKELRHFGYASYKTRYNTANQFEERCYYFYVRPDNNPEPEDPKMIPLGKKHQGTDKRRWYAGGKRQKRTPLSENLNELEKQRKSPYSENLKEGKQYSKNLNLENLKDNKNKSQGGKNNNCWKTALKILESHINRPSFNTWLRPTSLVSQNNGTIVIGVPDEIAIYWLGEYYIDVISDALRDILDREIEIKFKVDSCLKKNDSI